MMRLITSRKPSGLDAMRSLSEDAKLMASLSTSTLMSRRRLCRWRYQVILNMREASWSMQLEAKYSVQKERQEQ